jgi:primosomal protein N' (replication factor Y)
VLPVARVGVDVSLPHLDRPFDYLVEEGQDEAARAGCRVRVRFSGQLVGGVILERVDASEHAGRISFLERVVSSEPVLTTEIAQLAREVADRWAGTLADVVRLAVPPRHARAEAAAGTGDAPPAPALPGSWSSGLERYDRGAELVAGLAAGESPRAVVAALPGDWPAELAQVAAATLSSGRGIVVVVPDHRDVTRVDAALTAALGAGRHVALTADLGPAERYRRFLQLCRGEVQCVVGTRSAVWAPVKSLGAVVVWDDGDDLLAEPRAPYCHARDVAVLRAHLGDAALLLAGHAVTAEGAALTQSGWAYAIDGAGGPGELPTVRTATDDDPDDPLARAARLPTAAWKAARDALAAGLPVLVQVPRRGYQPSLACGHCRSPARCPACAGPLARPGADRPPTCRWCGVVATEWRCAQCGHTELRAVVVGARRTAEELGRAFPGARVRTSGGDAVLAEAGAGPTVVVATPGAEPVAADGYGAALLLDGWALLSRPDLRAGEEALRRWLNAAALVRPGAQGGRVVVVAPGELRPVQALLRWQPRWHAERENDERSALHLPPAARVASLTGPAEAVRELLEIVELPAGAEVLGPVPALGRSEAERPVERMLVRVPRRAGRQLADALKQATAVRSARKSPDAVRVELDPVVLG